MCSRVDVVLLQVPKKKKELAKEIREKAAPFVNWLQTAEEESSSEDDDVEVRHSLSPSPSLCVSLCELYYAHSLHLPLSVSLL